MPGTRNASNGAGGAAAGPTALEHGGVQLDLLSRRAFVDGRQVAFSAPEFRLLECLLRRPGRVVSQEELLGAVAEGAASAGPKLYRLVSRVREKLGHRRGGQIRTVHRWGLCFQSEPDGLVRLATRVPSSGPAPLRPGPRNDAAVLRHAAIGRRLPDAVWALFESVLPPAEAAEGRPVASNHRVLHGLVYLLSAGTGWRFVPPCFPRAAAIRRRLSAWLDVPAFHEAWAELARRYEPYRAIDWD